MPLQAIALETSRSGPGRRLHQSWCLSLSLRASVVLLWFGFQFFETEFLCVVLADLELTLWTRLASNSGPSASASCAGMKGVHHHLAEIKYGTLQIRMSSLHRGCADFLCIVLILVDVLPKQV